jgi:signal transduction histidine kinase
VNHALGNVVPLTDALAPTVVDLVLEAQRRDTMARVHHEIRTPLSALLAHIELLDREPDLEMPYLAEIAVAAIRRSGDRLRALMAELDDVVGEEPPGLTAGRTF